MRCRKWDHPKGDSELTYLFDKHNAVQGHGAGQGTASSRWEAYLNGQQWTKKKPG